MSPPSAKSTKLAAAALDRGVSIGKALARDFPGLFRRVWLAVLVELKRTESAAGGAKTRDVDI
jgi:hypothetical protein